MQLRHHPRMTRDNGCQSWPPLWTTTHHNRDEKPIGEIGSLEDVMMSQLIKDKLFMFMQHDGFRYMGFMCFDDARVCSDIYILLKSKVGLSIKEIGDLDLSDTL
jgi:hypothetical protein